MYSSKCVPLELEETLKKLLVVADNTVANRRDVALRNKQFATSVRVLGELSYQSCRKHSCCKHTCLKHSCRKHSCRKHSCRKHSCTSKARCFLLREDHFWL